MLWIVLGISISYLIGSIPTAYIFGRVLKGIDIRKFGSGNVGATNALRVLGKGPGIMVLALDIFKGFIAVTFIGDSLALKAPFLTDEALRIILGIICIAGHNWTIFLQFKGGKGIATTPGVLIALAVKSGPLQIISGLVIAAWFLVFIISRIVSLASLLAAIALPILVFLFRQSHILLATSVILALFVILRHKSNLIRIFRGEEPRLNFKKTKS